MGEYFRQFRREMARRCYQCYLANNAVVFVVGAGKVSFRSVVACVVAMRASSAAVQPPRRVALMDSRFLASRVGTTLDLNSRFIRMAKNEEQLHQQKDEISAHNGSLHASGKSTFVLQSSN